MRLLDGYCGAGGAAMGYHWAGFEVVGVDVAPQPHFPFEFHLGDAIEYIHEHGHEFDVIHTSPPCQAYSTVRHLGQARNGEYPSHADLILPTRDALLATRKPYIIENVGGARRELHDPIMLCGKEFGLKVYRHRWFESNIPLTAPEHIKHGDSTPSAGNGVSPKGFISVCGMGGVRGMKADEIVSYWSMAMGIDWMSRKEMTQAIPPTYTEYIGLQLMRYLTGYSQR